jgi:hypothetical protein
MKKILSCSLVSLLLAAASEVPARLEPPVPVPGPGAVVEAVQTWLAAATSDDAARIEACFVALPGKEGADYVLEAGSEQLTFRPVAAAAGGIRFLDVGADGKVVRGATIAEAVAAARTTIGGAGRELQHRVLSVRAHCPGADASWGVVEFERTFRRDGQLVCVPMQASVMVRHQAVAPHMRIFLWHASPTGPERQLKG